jgi:mono/diheme cytochrome c family protein/cytochrome c2
MKPIRLIVVIVVVLGLLVAVSAGIFIYAGAYNVSALAQHTTAVYKLLTFARIRSVAMRADTALPDVDSLDWRGEGLRLYEQHCIQCHGAPGIAPHSFSLGMMPAPSSIVQIGRIREPQEIYWVLKQGIKMSGMPAWDYRFDESQLWKVTALTAKLHTLTVDDYAQLRDRLQSIPEKGVAANEFDSSIDNNKIPAPEIPAEQLIEQGKIALQQYNCPSCHVIAGITAAYNHVGPPLTGIRERAFIAGILKNSDQNLIRWIQRPQAFDEDSTMPDLGVTDTHAIQMVAYLNSL